MTHTDTNLMALKSQIPYGTLSFPFAYFIDEQAQYQNGKIGWHWHSEVEFVRVTQGSVRSCAGKFQKELTEGEGIFINQNILHRFELTEESKMVSLVFSPQFLAVPYTNIFSNYIEPIINSNLYSVPLSNETVWERDALFMIDRIARTTQEGTALRELDIYISVLELWRLLFQNTIGNQNNYQVTPPDARFLRMQRRMEQMLTFIANNYSQKISSEDIALAAHISKSEAVRCFASLLHNSPIQYLNDYRLCRAAELLCGTDIPISAVAGTVGFGSNTYFTRLFHRRFQRTPAEMRKQKRHE